jgi:hypothetical protein
MQHEFKPFQSTNNDQPIFNRQKSTRTTATSFHFSNKKCFSRFVSSPQLSWSNDHEHAFFRSGSLTIARCISATVQNKKIMILEIYDVFSAFKRKFKV